MSRYYRVSKREYEAFRIKMTGLAADVATIRAKYEAIKEENKFLKDQNLTLIKQLTADGDPLPIMQQPHPDSDKGERDEN